MTNYMGRERQTTAGGYTNTLPEDYSSWSDASLLLGYDYWQQQAAVVAAVLGRIELAIVTRMTERQARAIPSEQFVCEIETKDTYSQPGFTPLKEVFQEADLATCFTAAHEETIQVPDKWSTVKVKALARKYGTEALAVVERARIPGAHRLIFKCKQ